jgi:hypothetical protein
MSASEKMSGMDGTSIAKLMVQLSMIGAIAGALIRTEVAG